MSRQRVDVNDYLRHEMTEESNMRRQQRLNERSAGKRVDVHEILKNETFRTSVPSCNEHFEKNRPCPTAIYGISDQYIVLDSYEKVRTSSISHGQFNFNFMVQGVTRDQNIGVKDKLDTIISIQVCEFCIPLLGFDEFDPTTLVQQKPALTTLGLVANGPLPAGGDAISNQRSQTPFCGRITLFLREVGMQSFSDADNRRHHFEFDAKLNATGDRIILTPVDNCDYYLFTDPIIDIHGLTLCFYNPTNEVRFAPDVLYSVSVRSDAAQLLEFSYSDPTNMVNLAVGDRIFIKGFSIGDNLIDAWINRTQGHIVGIGGYSLAAPTLPGAPTLLTFRLNPDVSTANLSTPIPANTTIHSATPINVYIAKNRVRIPLRLRRIVDRLTNYVAP